MSVWGWLARASVASIIALAFSGCGGGGGGDGSAQADPLPAAKLHAVGPLQVSARMVDGVVTGEVKTYIETDINSTRAFYFRVASSNNAIDQIAREEDNATASNYRVTFKSAALLGTGTFSDTVTVTACYDSNCQQQITDSPQTVNVTLTVMGTPPPAPAALALAPSTVSAGISDFYLAVSGSQFTNDSVGLWNGNVRDTFYVSSSLLLMRVSAADVASAGSAAITVTTQSADGGVATSAPLSFTIAAPGAALSLSLSANVLTASSGDLLGGATLDNAVVVAVNGATSATYYYKISWLGGALGRVDVNPGQDSSAYGTNPPTGSGAGRITAPGGGTVTGRIIGPTVTLTLSPVSTQLLGGGTFTDTLSVQVCTDAACTQPIGGSPQTLTFNYTVAGNAPTQALFSIDSPIWIEAATSDAGAPAGAVPISSNGLPPAGVYVTATADAGSAIAAASVQSNLDGTGTLTVRMKSPQTLGSGIYTTNVQVAVCLDMACTRPAVHGQFTVPVTYIVDASEGIDYTSRVLAQEVSSMVWNATNQRIYAIAPSYAASHAESLLTINPVTGTIDNVKSLSNQMPFQIAVSDDGTYAYICTLAAPNAKLLRVKLADYSIDQTLTVTTSCDGVAVAPGNAHTVALTSGNANITTLSIYDDAVRRGNTFSTGVVEQILPSTWGADPSTLFVLDSAPLTPAMDRLSVSASGLALSGQHGVGAFTAGAALQFAGGLVYFNTALVYDPVAGAMQAPFALLSTTGNSPFSTTFVADAALGRGFALTSDEPLGSHAGDKVTLQGFNLSNRQPTWVARMPAYNGMAGQLIRWGTNGLAYQSDLSGQFSLVLLSGSVVQR